MLSIAYVSVGAGEMSEQQLLDNLVAWRATNGRHDITGALVYHQGRFVQMLEGPDEAVRARFAVIAADPRHRSVQRMREKAIVERQFPEWTMGFRARSSESLEQLEGFENFFERRGSARLKHAENEAQQFLEWLGEYWLPRP